MDDQSSLGTEDTLFPQSIDIKNDNTLNTLLEQYKLFVATSEKLVERRQKMNAFFLSVNAVLVSAIGLVIKDTIALELAILAVVSILVSGIVMCITWRRLVRSYAQLNTGKFAVIHLVETRLPLALFKAEWKQLGQGRDKTKYISSTKTEATVPIVFTILYILSAVAVLLWMLILRR